MKKHLQEFPCKAGMRRRLKIKEGSASLHPYYGVPHHKFVELDYDACLTCARSCGCDECQVLVNDFGKVHKS